MTIKGTFAKSSESSLSNFFLFFFLFLFLFLSGTGRKQRAGRRERALARLALPRRGQPGPAGTPTAGAASAAVATLGGRALSDRRDRQPRDGGHSKPCGATETGQGAAPSRALPWPPHPLGPCRTLRIPHSSQSLRPRGPWRVGGGGRMPGQCEGSRNPAMTRGSPS